MEPSFCTFAAKSGNILALEWLRARGCSWTSDATYAAFIAGKMEALLWLRTQKPACPWLPLSKRWTHKADLPKDLSWDMDRKWESLRVILDSILTAARSTKEAEAKSFFAELTMEILDALNNIAHDAVFFQVAWTEVADAGHLPAIEWPREA